MNRARGEGTGRYDNKRKSTPLLAAIAPPGSPWNHFLLCDRYQPVWRGAGGQGGYTALQFQLEAWLEVMMALVGPFDDWLFIIF